jgi:hypothetical protein
MNEFRTGKIILPVEAETRAEKLVPASRFLPKFSHAIYGN